MTKTSRILTLVFTDLADSTALKSERGDDAVGDLISRHREHVTRLARESSGRIIDWAGDGCFLTFETATAGVMFALQLQQAHSDESDLPGVRVGLHLGEITEKPLTHGGAGVSPANAGVRIEGLAVDIAARVSGLARPGQVLMSAAVYNSARQRLGVEAFGQPVMWQTHGTYEFKGFDEHLVIGEAGVEGIAPLEAPRASDKARLVQRAKRKKGESSFARSDRRAIPIWAIGVIAALLVVVGILLGRQQPSPADVAAPNESEAFDAARPITSLAVLPLDNLMNDPEQDYFSDGMTEAITAELAKIKALRVVSRTSVMRYKNTNLSMREIAAELGVEGLIEGSVLRDGEDVRITVQLIDGRTDTHLWSESYTETITSVLKLQADIALAVAEEINATITPEERRRVTTAREVNPEAYENYLLGSHFLDEFTEEGQAEAAQYFQKATELDPDFADAWVGLGESFSYSSFRPSTEGTPAARAAYLRALELDGTNAEAHGGLGKISMYYDREWEQAEARFKRAIELAPNDADAYVSFATNRLIVGRHDEALRLASTALDLDPENHRALHEIGWVFTFTGELDRGRQVLERALELRPDFILAIEILMHNHIMSGNFDEGIAMAQRHIDASGGDVFSKLDMVDALAMAGRVREAEDYLNEVLEGDEYVQPGDLAWAYVKLGKIDEAFAAFEEGFKRQDWVVVWLNTAPYWPGYTESPFYQTFRQDPRYRDLIERMRFPTLPPEHPGYADQQAWIAKKAAAEEANAPIRKIAVLPFENMSSDPEQEFFVDGMTEALIAELAKIKSLKVISRTSVMRYKNTDKSLKEIALELGVDGIVEGSVLKAGNDVRITAQLINGRTDEHIWAESYTNSIENVLKLQAEVALAIADEIGAVVTQDERARITAAPVIDSRAYELYIEGRALWSERTATGFEGAIDRFERALVVAPDFALAHLGLADTYMQQADYLLTTPVVAYEQALVRIERAFELGEPPGEAYSSRARYKMLHDADWAGSMADFERALELNPADPTAHLWYGVVLNAVGRKAEMLREVETALELDPFSPIIVGYHLQQFATTGRSEETLQRIEEVELEFPESTRIALALALAYEELGQCNDAITAARRYYDQGGGDLVGSLILALVHARCGDENAARAQIEARLSIAVERRNGAMLIASIYASLGESDESLEWLERALEWRDPNIVVLHSWKEFRSLHDDPRYQNILQRIGLPVSRSRN